MNTLKVRTGNNTMPHRADPAAQGKWFAVKCLFSHQSRSSDADGNLYEERITVWRCAGSEEAFALAEAEAGEYASEEGCSFVRSTDSYHLFEESVNHGSEVWSVMRGSHMDPEMYAQTFCATARDRSSDFTPQENSNEST